MEVTLKELKRKLKKIHSENKKIVFTNGCFDIIHSGHIHLLEKAKELGDVLVVGLNSDKSIRKIKGEKRPILKQEDRIKILTALKPVDFVVLFDEETPLKLIEEIQPDILVKGKDYRKKEIVGKDIIEKNNGKIVTIDLLDKKSTTKIIQRIVKLYGK